MTDEEPSPGMYHEITTLVPTSVVVGGNG